MSISWLFGSDSRIQCLMVNPILLITLIFIGWLTIKHADLLHGLRPVWPLCANCCNSPKFMLSSIAYSNDFLTWNKKQKKENTWKIKKHNFKTKEMWKRGRVHLHLFWFLDLFCLLLLLCICFFSRQKNKKMKHSKKKGEKHYKCKKNANGHVHFCPFFVCPLLFPFCSPFILLSCFFGFCWFVFCFFPFVFMFYRFVSNLLILRVSNCLVNKNLNIHKLEIICFWDTTIPIIIYGYLWIPMGRGHLPKLNQPVFAEITLSPDDAHSTLPRR